MDNVQQQREEKLSDVHRQEEEQRADGAEHNDKCEDGGSDRERALLSRGSLRTLRIDRALRRQGRRSRRRGRIRWGVSSLSHETAAGGRNDIVQVLLHRNVKSLD